MIRKGAPPKPFQMIAGHPALDFINSLDDRFAAGGPVELVTGYDDLLRFVCEAKLISEPKCRKLKKLDAGPRQRSAVLADALRLREAVSAVVYALLAGADLRANALMDLESLFKDAADHRRLVLDNADSVGVPPRLAWEYKDVGGDIHLPVWLLAQAANDLLTSSQSSYLRKCGELTCQWVFLDTSKNRTRRWCDMKICGNRNKARLFQLRKGSKPVPPHANHVTPVIHPELNFR